MSTDLHELESSINYVFKEKALLQQAITRTAFSKEQVDMGLAKTMEDQEVLATLGDAVLKLVLTEELMKHGASTPEEITERKQAMESREALARVAEDLGLSTYIRFGKGEVTQGIQHHPSVMGESLEALVGAIYLEGGLAVARRTILSWDSIKGFFQ